MTEDEYTNRPMPGNRTREVELPIDPVAEFLKHQEQALKRKEEHERTETKG